MGCNGNKEGNGNCDEGGRQATVKGIKWAMARARRVAGDEEGNGDSGKSNGNGNKGGG